MKTKKQEDALFKLIYLKVLRMNGFLLPETEDEVQAFYERYGDEMVELPDKFKTIDFLFEGWE